MALRKRSNLFVALRGGDGGIAPRLRPVRGNKGDVVAMVAMGQLYRNENARVILTGATLDATYPTRDPADRAHSCFDDRGMLVPAADSRGNPNRILGDVARPRRYHPSQLNGHGVAWDSVFDATHQRQRELSGIPGVGIEAASRDRAVQSRTVPHLGEMI